MNAEHASARPGLRARLATLFNWMGVDLAVFFGVSQQLWSATTGTATLLLIGLYFSPVLQGYYFTFYSLLGLQIFAELGFGQVIIQFASHEWAKLRFDETGQVVGDADALSRLTSLGRFAISWFTLAASVIVPLVGMGGLWFFRSAHHPGVNWRLPWLALCLTSGLLLCMLPLWSLLLGCNQVTAVYRFRLVEDVSADLTLWAAIALHGGLWAPALASVAKLVCNAIFLSRGHLHFLKALLRRPQGATISWRGELLDLQWRFAVSFLSGYFTFTVFTPIAFRLCGPVVAGQVGMSWSMAMAVLGVAVTWINARIPTFGVLIARRQYEELDRLMFRCAAAAFGVAACGAIAIVAGLETLHRLHLPLAQRALPPLPTALLLIAIVLLAVAYAPAAYLRAHKREPLMGLSVVQAVLVTTLSLWLARKYGGIGIASSFLAVMGLIMFPGATLYWFHLRTKWHSVPA